ncbi:hypothetical protein Q3G72_015984 [Acer saccharum]|nr:hypothetical protein Q3G72_015984 [Acer saccharum]
MLKDRARFVDGSKINGGKDFRQSLVSVFIGNLNPEVDSRALWGIFKVFGKPIKAKVASYDWNSRRKLIRQQVASGIYENGFYRGARNDIGSINEDTDSRRHVKNGKSYAEVVKEADSGKYAKEEGMEEPVRNITMSWKGSFEVEEWLSRSVVGVLKNFNSIKGVNQKLDDRGFLYTSTFMGGKNIVWTFQSQCERDSFINNRFLWEQCFFSMKEWKEQSQVQELKKISWVEVYGVPLKCWCRDFFLKIGEHVGEVLWIDRATEHRWRLDVGKLLVSKPLGHVQPCEVVAKDGRRSTTVKLVECPTPVTEEWISSQLGLRPHFSNLNCRPEKEGLDMAWSESRTVASEEVGEIEKVKVGDGEAVNSSSIEKKENRNGVRKQSMYSPILGRKEVGGGKMVLEKGKGQCCQKVTATYRQRNRDGVVKIGTQRKSVNRGKSEESKYSSSGFEPEDGPVTNGLLLRGECSNFRTQGIPEGSGPFNELYGLGSPVDSKKERRRAYSYSEKAGGDRVGTSPIGKKLLRSLYKGCSEISNQSQSGEREISSNQVVPETQMAPEQGINIIVDLRPHEKEDLMIEEYQGSRMAEDCSDSDNRETSKTVGNCGCHIRDGSENDHARRAKRRRGRGEGSGYPSAWWSFHLV